MNRRTFLRCIPAAPALLVAAPAVALQAGQADDACRVEIGDFVEGREVMDVCESCSRPLFEGDKVFSYSDGPTFCEADAPTWNDLKDMQDEDIAAGIWEEHFETAEEAQDARESVLAHIEAGQGDVKYVWAL